MIFIEAVPYAVVYTQPWYAFLFILNVSVSYCVCKKIGVSALLGLLLGLLYSHVGHGQQSISDRKGILFFVRRDNCTQP